MLRTLRLLGPGLLFAGSAIGVSHVYQSTRAGAEYGYALVGAVLLANALKYPFFEFGPRYALASGETLLAGYLRLGRWVLGTFLAVTLLTIFTVQAAVTGVTVALVQHAFGWHGPSWAYAAGLLALCALLLLAGRYRALDRTVKAVVVLLSVCTVAALAVAFAHPAAEPVTATVPFRLGDPAALAFLIGLVGWMPAPIDLSVWHSAWALEKRRLEPGFGPRQALFDFRIGYAGTALLAVVFLALGARMLHGQIDAFPESAAAFGTLLIDLYRYTLGGPAGAVIALAAVATMFSTTLTVLDAIPRVLAQAVQLLAASEANRVPGTPHTPRDPADIPGTGAWYTVFLVLLVTGALSLIRWFAQDLRALVDVATILSFGTAPFFAVANYALITGRHTPAEHRPGPLLRAASRLGIAFLVGFGLWYGVQRFGG